MKKLFPLLLFFLCAIFLNIQPAQAVGYDWEKVSTSGMDADARVYISPFYNDDNCLYALVGNDFYLSRSEGETWRKISTMPVYYVQVATDQVIYTLQEETDGKMAIYYYDSTRDKWHRKCDAPTNARIFAVLANGINTNVILTGRQYVSSSIWQILRTTNNGQIWKEVDYNRGGYLFAPAPDGSTVLTREYDSNLGSYSTDGGDTWKSFGRSYELDNFFVSPNYMRDNKIFAITGRTNVNYTLDLGDNWFTATRGLGKTNPLVDIAFSLNYVRDKTMFAADQKGRVYVSKTDEINWSDMGIELPSGATLNNVVALPDNTTLFAGANDGIYKTGSSGVSGKIPQTTVITRSMTVQFRLNTATYTINTGEWQIDAFPYQENDRVYVPVRYLAYGLSISDQGIDWNEKTKEVTLTKDGVVVKMKLDSQLLYVNEQEIRMDVTPQMTTGDRVMLPARWVAEAFGASVSWDEAQKVVTIKYEEPEKS